MCFGGGGSKAPDVPPPPPPAPVPTASEPTELAAQTNEQRANQTNQLKYGILSTIKTKAGGIAGTGADLVTAQAGGTNNQKKTLGGA